jgi:SAM-dependent methyltransferase
LGGTHQEEVRMSRDPYRDFAEVYDAWQRLYPQPFSMAMAPRIRAAIRDHHAPLPVLADLACGTGTLASWWKRTHPAWTVYGTDLSPAMIRMARAAHPSSGPRTRVSFLVQDLRDLRLSEPVGVATCIFDSLNHITREADLARVFRRVHRSLAPGGLFLFDLVEELTFPEVFTGSSIFDGEHLYLGMDTEYREERNQGIGIARFTFFRRSGSSWRRIDFNIRERRWFRGEIRDLLHAAGLDLIRLEKISPYTSKEFFVPRTFWICRRGR